MGALAQEDVVSDRQCRREREVGGQDEAGRVVVVVHRPLELVGNVVDLAAQVHHGVGGAEPARRRTETETAGVGHVHGGAHPVRALGRQQAQVVQGAIVRHEPRAQGHRRHQHEQGAEEPAQPGR